MRPDNVISAEAVPGNSGRLGIVRDGRSYTMAVAKRAERLSNRKGGPAFNTAKAPLNDQRRLSMRRELNPVESRGGVVSGRVMLVLLSSSVGAIIALALAWALFIRPH